MPWSQVAQLQPLFSFSFYSCAPTWFRKKLPPPGCICRFVPAVQCSLSCATSSAGSSVIRPGGVKHSKRPSWPMLSSHELRRRSPQRPLSSEIKSRSLQLQTSHANAPTAQRHGRCRTCRTFLQRIIPRMRARAYMCILVRFGRFGTLLLLLNLQRVKAPNLLRLQRSAKVRQSPQGSAPHEARSRRSSLCDLIYCGTQPGVRRRVRTTP